MKEIESYKPFPKQQEFHASDALYKLFGGAAGPGKSEAIMWEAVKKCLRKKVDGVLFRKTYPELEMSLIKRFLEKVPADCYIYNGGNHLAKFKNGSTLLFAYCDNERDVYRYQSAEFDFIGVDELTHFTEYFFLYITSRLRSIKEGVRPSFFAATNPGNIGNVWVRKRFITKDCNDKTYDPKEYDFVPARLSDNPVLMQNDPNYIRRLEALPEQQRKALLEGSFDIFEGQAFQEWNVDVHVVKPFAIPESWAKIRSIDPSGRNGITAGVWLTIDSDKNVYCYREYYETGLDSDQHARRIAQLSEHEDYKYTTIDTAAYSKLGLPETQSEVYERNGVLGLIPSSKARIAGWDLLHSYLRWDANIPPKLKFFSNCSQIIRTLPLLITDPRNPEDIDTTMDDHLADALRYAVQTLRDQASPVEVQVNTMQTIIEKRLKGLNNNGKYSFRYTRQ